uniref:Transposase n=1 Tax=Plectus sambesii TaxID=2011161 RepID=A0A914XBE1_9BILA
MQPSEIAKRLSVHRVTIRRTIHRFQELGTSADHPKTGRPKSSNTAAVRDKLRLRLMRNSRRLLRKVAKEIIVNRGTVRQMAKNVMKLKAYKLQKAHLLTDHLRQVRLQRSKALLQLDATWHWETMVFLDEKIFTLEQQFNSQYDRLWSANLSSSILDARTVARSQKPAYIMVWAAITSSCKTLLYFVDPAAVGTIRPKNLG